MSSASRWVTLIVAAIVVFFAAGLPLLDTLIEPRRTTVAAGSSATLTIGGGSPVGFVPAAGWERVDAGDDPSITELAHRGISFEVQVTDVPAGTVCADALDRAEASLQETDATGRLLGSQTFATAPGQIGIQAPFVAARTEAVVFVVCSGDLIATAVASGPVGALQGVAADADAVAAMARSIELP